MRIFHKFTNQIKFSFILLSAFALIQAALTLWVARQSDYHIEKGRISNKILTELIDLGGNKQRLKVWFAQYLLTNDSSTEVRNTLLFKMNSSLNNLSQLLQRDLELNRGNSAEVIIINEQMQRHATLKENIKALEDEVMKISKGIYKNPGDAWIFMIKIFDNLDGNDLRKLINNAIEIQKLRATEAETTAKNYIDYFNNSVYALTVIILTLTIILLSMIQKSVRQPIVELVQAAQEFSKGNMAYRIPEVFNNEFGLVATKINEMATELQKSRNDEIKKRIEIEKEIQDRTSELKAAVDKLQRSEFERKIFLSNISHELKTPATAILGESSVTLRGADKDIETYKETLKNIQIIGRQLSNRIEDLLLLARTDSDIFRVNLKNEGTDILSSAVKEALKISDPNSEANFEINNRLDNNKKVLVDYDRITQLLVILFDNARRYSTVGSPIEVMCRTTDNAVELVVKNKCLSLGDIDYQKIFDRYYRSHKARVLKPDGLGIGLFLAEKIVSSHYGSIVAQPQEPDYFNIVVSLPLEGVHQ